MNRSKIHTQTQNGWTGGRPEIQRLSLKLTNASPDGRRLMGRNAISLFAVLALATLASSCGVGPNEEVRRSDSSSVTASPLTAEEGQMEAGRILREHGAQLDALGVVGIYYDPARAAMVFDVDAALEQGVDPMEPSASEREQLTSESRERAELELHDLTATNIVIVMVWGVERVPALATPTVLPMPSIG